MESADFSPPPLVDETRMMCLLRGSVPLTRKADGLGERGRDQTAGIWRRRRSMVEMRRREWVSTASTSFIGPSIDELLLQVDAQAALIEEMGNLCDVAEAMVAEKEERVTRSLLELPVWGSPRDLVAALTDSGGGDDDLID
ncbi:hypothetical protein QJS10_CPB04g01516 [Acorus calamus]|uniref:Uncharacterized protein n=1 Tax=Acorus calamus TaxID=4465 RepID=A0AAV9F118_ACOCL|nr:hypothetical protein QJS10_CPB04g01516 [Acorus calamus]